MLVFVLDHCINLFELGYLANYCQFVKVEY